MRHETETRPDQHRLMIFVEQLQSQGMSEREISDTLRLELTEERPADTTRRPFAAWKTQLFGSQRGR